MAVTPLKKFAALTSIAAAGACAPSGTANNEAANTQSTTEAATGMNAAQTEAPNLPAASDESVSSGMPVPGTNTPEHVVVNEGNSVNKM
jgi:hypothetical protein